MIEPKAHFELINDLIKLFIGEYPLYSSSVFSLIVLVFFSNIYDSLILGSSFA